MQAAKFCTPCSLHILLADSTRQMSNNTTYLNTFHIIALNEGDIYIVVGDKCAISIIVILLTR